MRGAGERELQKREISSSNYDTCFFIGGQDLILAIVFRRNKDMTVKTFAKNELGIKLSFFSVGLA